MTAELRSAVIQDADVVLTHYSAGLVEHVRAVEQVTQPDFKPVGFWISVERAGHEDDWRSWCLSEGFGLDRLAHRYRVELTADPGVLWIRTGSEFDTFHERFQAVRNRHIVHPVISWKRVAEHYTGLIIAPYLWNKRLLGPIWYFTWDCASGCIWDPRAISSVQLELNAPA